MRFWSRIASTAGLIVASALFGMPAEAQQRNWCSATVGTTVYFSGTIVLPGYTPSSADYRRMREEFQAHMLSIVPRVSDLVCHAHIDHDPETSMSGRQTNGYRVVRTEWTRNYMANAGPQRTPPSGVGREPGVYITLPTSPGAGSRVDSVEDSEASRRAVAARYRQQQEEVRRIAENNARQQAEHRARLAETERQRAAHRAAVAENARQQDAYRRSRADWEAEIARCRAARSCAVPR